MKDSKKSKFEKGRSVLVLTSFEIEIEGSKTFIFHEEVDLTKLGPRELIEDWNENENSSKN